MNDHILKWGPFLDRAIRKWAVKCPKDRREDLKHECYIKIISDKSLEPRMQELRGVKAINKYMAGTARNLVCGLHRQAPEEHVDWVPMTEIDQHKKIEMDTSFVEMLSVLTQEERAIITLSYRDHATNADIARRYGRSWHWVQKTLDRSIQKLRKSEGADATANT